MQAGTDIIGHLPHHAGVTGHEGQLKAPQKRLGQLLNVVALIDGGVRIVLKRHLLTQDYEDAREEKRKEDLHQGY